MRSALLIGMCLSGGIAQGQINGVIADTIGGRRVPGAAITILDADRKVIRQALADDSGRFSIADVAAARHLRVVKIGYRPAERAVTSPASVQIAMQRLPSLLEPVRTFEQPQCSRNSTRAAAFGLWEQARAALLANVIARETNQAMVWRTSFRRYMTERGDDIAWQAVRLDSSVSLRSFDAVLSAREFAKRGFAEVGADGHIQFYGPDAEVLLDDALVGVYCIELASQRERPAQVGLRFRPMKRKEGRVDIDGTLWIDTVKRELRDLDFRYLGLDRDAEGIHPGGIVSFHSLANGVTFIDHWNFRVPVPGIDTMFGENARVIQRRYYTPREVGGEVASAQWPDSVGYDGRLGTLRGKAVDASGTPVIDVVIRLEDTDYIASPDVWGEFQFDRLYPGPYHAVVILPEVAHLGAIIPTPLRFTAARDSVIAGVRMLVPDARLYFRLPCSGDETSDEEEPALRILVTKDGERVEGAYWELSKSNGVPGQNVIERRQTTGDGRVHYCMQLEPGEDYVIRAAQDRDLTRPRTIRGTVHKRNTAVRVELP